MKDGYYDMEITDLNTRSDRQNKALWGWYYKQVEVMFFTTGLQLTILEIHEYFKYKFLQKRKKCKITKRYRSITGSTQKLSKKGYSQYIEKIDIFCIQRF